MAMCCSDVQLCLTLHGPMDCSPPDSSVHGILQVRILEWVAMPSFRGYPQPLGGYPPKRGIEPTSLISLAFASGFFTTSAPWEVPDGYGRPLNPKSGPPSSLPVIIV